MYAVVKIYEETLTVGLLESCISWELALELAFESVLDEYEVRGLDISGDAEKQSEIQAVLQEKHRYLFESANGDCNENCEPGKAVMIQIVSFG